MEGYSAGQTWRLIPRSGAQILLAKRPPGGNLKALNLAFEPDWPAVQRRVVIGVESLPGCRCANTKSGSFASSTFLASVFLFFSKSANDPVIKEARFAKYARRLKRGFWGESRSGFSKSIVERSQSQAVCGTYASRRLDDRLGLFSAELLSA